MVNCNPETVSTDYDTSDRLYFEPLTFEDVMAIVEEEKPTGVIVQFGGQTPLNLARQLKAAGVPIIGTSPESIDLAEDRKHFGKLLADLGIPQPENGAAMNVEEALEIARRIGYPVLVRPSYVLGGRAMVIAYDEATLRGLRAPRRRTAAGFPHPGRPLPRERHGSGRGRALPTAKTSWWRASWSTSRRPASIPATAPACCRRCRSPRASVAPCASTR